MHTVAVIVGSLRKESKNAMLAKALAKLAAPRLEFRRIRIDDLPMMTGDDLNDPAPAVLRFKDEVEACDAVLFVVPEHNRAVPAPLKNAYDWGTRPTGRDSWRGKPAAIIGTTPGTIGTAVAQQNMRMMASGHVAALLGFPDAFIKYQEGMYDADFNVTNEDTKKFLQTFIDQFTDFVEALAGKMK